MARPLTGSVYPVKGGYGIRWLENGRRRRRCPSPPFPSKTAARRWFRADVLPRREAAGPAAPSADVTFEDYCERFLERQTTAPSTFATLRDRLRSARQTFGRWTLAQLEYDIAAWRAGRCPKAQGSGTPAALRQCLAAAVRWRYLDRNPAVDAGTNAKPRSREIDPFDPDELAAIYAEFDVPDRQLVTSARETGLRPEEWCALTSIVPAAGSPSSGSSPRAG
ncbi:MAG TPA: hypothetical protein VGI50_17025 [Solirubrobacteraceae bacterium]